MPLERVPRKPALELDRVVQEGAHPAIIITGATSAIGKEIARLATLEDAFLLVVDSARRQLDALVAELRSQGAQVAALSIDLASPGAVRSIERALAAHDLYCDVLVNAGARALFGPASGIAADDQLTLIALNVRTLTELTLRFLPEMIARGRGGILNLGSIAGYTPGPNMAVYAASKAFVNSFTAALASELAHTGVSVTCVAPGLGIRHFLQRCPTVPPWLPSMVPQPNTFDAAVAAWLAFKNGRRLVTPKWTGRLAYVASRLLQDSILLRFLGALQRPPEAI